jgi:hypothetical protein
MENAITGEAIEKAVEFGAGAVLSGLLKRINNAIPRAAVGAVSDVPVA